MFVKLKSGKKVVSMKARYMADANEQAIGLMFYKRGDVLMDIGRESVAFTAIHTWFCRPMFVVWLDKGKKVVDLVQARPWRAYSSRKPAQYVFETTESGPKLRVGQKLSFKKL